MNRIKKSLFLITLLLPFHAFGQLAEGQNKFLGNIIGLNGIPADFSSYWNQITPENSGKWQLAEGSRDVMNWAPLDEMYNYSRSQSFPFKEHTLVWGSQEPQWVAGLSPAEQAAEVEEWIQLYAQRYPDTEMIDVVNEPLHVLPSYKDAIGGDGATGWDWVIWSFEKARQYSPNAQLLINDYSILNNTANVDAYLVLINLLKDRGLIDGIGVQAHGLENTSASTVQSNLDRLATTGLPIYVSEFEIDRRQDNRQKNKYEELFPVFWDHPAVAGVTLWGYREGAIWKPNAYLVRSDGTERPALVWLRDYLANYNGGGGSNGTKVFVASVLSEATSSKGNKKGKATVVIHDDTGAPYANAVVTGTFTGTINETHSATTNGSGTAVFNTTASVKGGIVFTFCVDDVSAALPYDPTLNQMDCDALGASRTIAGSSAGLFPGTVAAASSVLHYTGATKGSYRLFSMSGQMLARGAVDPGAQLELPLRPGRIYILQLQTAEGMFSRKIIGH